MAIDDWRYADCDGIRRTYMAVTFIMMERLLKLLAYV